MSEPDLEITLIPVEQSKKLTDMTNIEYYEYLMEMERKIESGEIGPNICPWTGEPHDFEVH